MTQNNESVSTILARQINCRRRDVATRSVIHWRKAQIVFLTEPHTPALHNIRHSGTIYCDKNYKRARSAIYVNNSCVNGSLIPHLTNRDIVSVLLEKQETIVVSAYLHNDFPKRPDTAWPMLLDEIAEYARIRQFKLIIGADSNAWSELWHSKYTNARGEVVEEGIARHGLFVCNQGDTLTFNSHVGKSIIDITLASDPSMITNWEVLDQETSYSDHNIISFEIMGISQCSPILHRSLKNVNWKSIATELKSAMIFPTPDQWSCALLDEACDALASRLQESLDFHAPKKPFRQKSSYWWSQDCSAARTLSRKKDKIARRRPTLQNKKAAREAINAYQKTIYEAKKKSWQTFISDVDGVHAMARVSYILKNIGKSKMNLGLVKKHDGDLAENKEESLVSMMQVHFPNCRVLTTPVEEGTADTTMKTITTYPWLSRVRFRAACEAFKKNKTPGEDEVRAELLSAMDDELADYILTLIGAGLTLHYTPKSWRKVNVIFLPKDGKPDYADCKAWRPISLLSVAMKLAERLLLWHMEDTSLLKFPTHHHQYGATKGKSCDHALSTMTNIIEKGMNQNMFVLTVFMDIRGAFDNINFESIITAMREREVHPDIIAFYRHFLYNRSVSSTLGESTVEVCPAKGTPQGGVLSCRVAWNLTFEGFLKNTENSPVTSIGFVDDGSLSITGTDINVLYKEMQKAIDGALGWASSHGLEFCPKKTVSMLFSHRAQPSTLPKLRLYGKQIPHVTETKLLGVTFDANLNWHAHINKRIHACRIALLQLRPVVGHCWSPEPQYLRWVYEACILPMLTYGCVIWGHAAQEPTIRSKLNKLQRLALTSIAPVRRSTPTAALEILYNISPIPLSITEKAQQTFLRLGQLQNVNWTHSYYNRWRTAEFCNKRRGHLTNIRLSLPTITLDDDMTPLANFDRRYSVTIEYEQREKLDDVAIFTDGSGKDGRIGSGSYFLVDDEPFLTKRERLPSSCTVYQAELRGIQMSCEFLIQQGYQSRTIAFHIDNQASLCALKAPFISSRFVYDTAAMLNFLGKNNIVSLQWVKAHHTSENNKYADDVAKTGGETNFWSPIEYLESRVAMKNHIRILRNESWSRIWRKNPDCRQSKLFFSGPDPKIWQSMRKLNKSKISNIIRFMTGHGYFRRHRTVIKKKKRRLNADRDPDSLCRLCQNGIEDSAHLLLECPALMWTRHTTFARDRLVAWQLDTPPPFGEALIAFINSKPIRALEDEREEN